MCGPELVAEANLPVKDTKTLSSDLIEYVQHMVRQHGDNYKVRKGPVCVYPFRAGLVGSLKNTGGCIVACLKSVIKGRWYWEGMKLEGRSKSNDNISVLLLVLLTPKCL